MGIFDLAKEYWYITIAAVLVAIVLLVGLIFLLVKMSKKFKEDSEVKKARKKEQETAATTAKQKELERSQQLAKMQEAPAEEKPEEIAPEVDEQEETVVAEESAAASDADGKPTPKAVYRVIYDRENKEWMVKKDGAQRVIRRVKTKAEALELAHQFATNQELALSVQKKDGKFQKKRNYQQMMTNERNEKQ